MIVLLARSLAPVLAIVGAAFMLPLAAAWWYGETGHLRDFLLPALAAWTLALGCGRLGRLRQRLGAMYNAFAIVGGAWLAVGFFGSLPFALSGCFQSYTDALFESVSGFTTTGASVLGDVEALPRCLNLWRCLTHWLGGMGVIALAVAVIPMLGAGGYRLVQAETSGPEKGKLTTRMRDTAKILWTIYVVLTAAQTLLLAFAGMGWFDALCHAFSTMGTGGFSTRNASIAAFALPAAEWICTLFMLMASVNFAVYYLMLTGRWREVAENSELRGFVFIVAAACAAAIAANCAAGAPLARGVREGAFQIASIVSTTGFCSADYLRWTPAAQSVVLALFLVGGCAGSTAGGVKVVRWTVLAKQLRNDIERLLHPHGVFTLRINGSPARAETVSVVATFIFVYVLLAALSTFAGALAGLDLFTALTAALSMQGNIGPAFGALGPTANYGGIAPALKWWYCFAMLAGRLEIYTLLIMVGGSLPRGGAGHRHAGGLFGASGSVRGRE